MGFFTPAGEERISPSVWRAGATNAAIFSLQKSIIFLNPLSAVIDDEEGGDLSINELASSQEAEEVPLALSLVESSRGGGIGGNVGGVHGDDDDEQENSGMKR